MSFNIWVEKLILDFCRQIGDYSYTTKFHGSESKSWTWKTESFFWGKATFLGREKFRLLINAILFQFNSDLCFWNDIVAISIGSNNPKRLDYTGWFPHFLKSLEGRALWREKRTKTAFRSSYPIPLVSLQKGWQLVYVFEKSHFGHFSRQAYLSKMTTAEHNSIRFSN